MKTRELKAKQLKWDLLSTADPRQNGTFPRNIAHPVIGTANHFCCLDSHELPIVWWLNPFILINIIYLMATRVFNASIPICWSLNIKKKNEGFLNWGYPQIMQASRPCYDWNMFFNICSWWRNPRLIRGTPSPRGICAWSSCPKSSRRRTKACSVQGCCTHPKGPRDLWWRLKRSDGQSLATRMNTCSSSTWRLRANNLM
jgi:hypothetical protein